MLSTRSHAARLASLALISSFAHADTEVHVQNTGISSGNFVSGAGLAAWVVHEFETGNPDLNGDGDRSDTVIHVQRTSDRDYVNLALAGNPLEIVGKRALLLVSESNQGVDLNGDGDSSDSVFHVYDGRTGEVTNLERAGFVGFLTEDLAILSVSEALNGGTDLNGDGDASESVLQLFDLESGSFTNLGVAAAGLARRGIQATRSVVAFAVTELTNGNADLNGDGDKDDNVLHLFHLATGEIENLGFALSPFGQLPAVLLTERWLAFSVDEASQNATDLDGDEDALDAVAHLLDLRTRECENLELAIAHTQNDLLLSDELLVVRASEAHTGGLDANGDGDAEDSTLFVRRLAAGEQLALGLAVSFVDDFDLSGGLLAFCVDEAAQGNTDLNGDGDAEDRVAHVSTATGDPSRNLELAVLSLLADGRWAAFNVYEAGQGETDLNGDGDAANDGVLFVYDSVTGVVQNLRYAAQSVQWFTRFRERSVVFFVSELTQNADINGDGDSFDLIPRVQSLPTGTGTDFGVTGANAIPAMSLAGGVVTFRVQEGAEGVDLNGDGDTFDMVLHFARLTPPSSLSRAGSL